MTFTYILTTEEEVALVARVTELNANLPPPKQTTPDKEMRNIMQKFLKTNTDRLELAKEKKLNRAYKQADDSKKLQVRSILGVDL